MVNRFSAGGSDGLDILIGESGNNQGGGRIMYSSKNVGVIRWGAYHIYFEG